MELFWQVLTMFVIVPVIGIAYVAFVHLIGALVIRLSPPRLARILGGKLWQTQWDKARRVDKIRREVNRKNKRAGRAVEGELMPKE